MKKFFFPLLFFCFAVFIFFKALLVNGLLPVPADTIVGLYHPFRDFYAKDYPNGIPFKNFLITDPVRQQFVWKNLSLDLEKNFQLPLWNPYSFAGYPLLANFQSSSFYPLNIIFLILPFSIAWSIFILLQPLLAAIFSYLYLESLKLSKRASILGSLTFAFCGFSISWLEWGTIIHTALWLPLILLSADKILNAEESRAKLKWSFILLFSVLSSFFAGHLQTFFYICVFSSTYILLKLFIHKKIFRNLGVFLILGIIFILVSLSQLIPTLNFILLSSRNVDQSWLNPGWFIPWQNLIQFLIPDFFGNPATLNYWGIWNYGEFIGYIGIVSIVFAFFAIFRKDKKTLFFLIAVVVSLLFALPMPLAKIPYKFSLPFLSTAQPTRLMFVVDFSLSVLAALGFDYFLKTERKRIFYILGLLFLIFMSLWLYILNLGKGTIQTNLLVVRQNLIFPTSIFILVSAIFFLILIFPKKNIYSGNVVKLFSFLLIAVLLVDLFRFGWKYTPFTNKDYLYPSTNTINFLKTNLGNYRIMETDSRIFPPNFSNIYKFQSVDGYDPLYLQRYAEFAAAWGRGLPNILPPFGFNRIITPENYNSEFADLLGVKYILSLDPINIPSVKLVYSEGQTRVYENMNAFQRAFFIGRTVHAGTKQEAITLMFDKNYPLKYRAVVEDATNNNLSRTWSVGTAQIIDYLANRVTIKTQNQKEGFLILTDTYYPTWHVTIDGKETKIYRTDYNFRGVIVPKGNHTLDFYISIL